MDRMRAYEWQNLVVGAVGTLLTIALASPGTHAVAVGGLRLDAFYVPLTIFGALTASSELYLYRSRAET